MKLSTYIERLTERGWRREAAEEAAILATNAGATWDPEEPELAGRLTMLIDGKIRAVVPEGHPDLTPLGILAGPETGIVIRRLTPEEKREAAARYNALPRILGLLNRSTERCLDDGKTTNGIALRAEARAILQEERERLT